MNPIDPNQKQTPIYQPVNPRLSPLQMWKVDEPEKKTVPKPPEPIRPDPTPEDMNRESYKELSDEQKNLKCAGLVLSDTYRKFLKPYLETFTNPVRLPVKSKEDEYRILNENAIAEFVTNHLINYLESRARRSPSFQYTPPELLEEEIEEHA